MKSQKYKTSTANRIFSVISGNFFEMYDFVLLGMFAPMMANTFFPKGNYLLSLILVLFTFALGFLMRPLGAIVLGAYIDRNGRKKGLILSLSLTAVGTCAIAFCPDFATIGYEAPVIILLGRMAQGFSTGAELSGASVYLAEIAPSNRRGLFVSLQPASQQLAIILASVFGYLLNIIYTESQMNSFAWRIPFIFGCLLIPLVFFQRRHLEETPVFCEQKHRPQLIQIFRHLIKSLPFLLLCSFLVMLTVVSFQMLVVYALTYTKLTTQFSYKESFLLSTCIGLFNLILLPIMGMFSDKFGRFKMLTIFSIGFILTSYPALHWAMKNPEFMNVLIAMLYLSFLYTGYNGSMVVTLVEIVRSDIRTTSFSFAHSIAAAIYGGFTPIIATKLISWTGDRASPAIWLIFSAIMSLLAVLILKIRNKFKTENF